MSAPRKPTRAVKVGSVTMGGGHPVVVQSMAATKTTELDATIRQTRLLHEAGAGVVRIAIDSQKDAEALLKVREAVPEATLSVDLQENYRLAKQVARAVDKIRYNPGHLHHHETSKPVADKVKFLADVAGEHDCAIRVGVNCGSVDPKLIDKFGDDDISPMVESALEHCAILDGIGFTRYVVSLKDSDPRKVVEANRRFSAQRPDVPLHLGVTEAGLPPDGVIKTRIAFEQLLAQGIGDTLRVSLTLPFDRKAEEVQVGRDILADVAAGRFRSVPEFLDRGLNIISCPSCSRVENNAFVDLAIAVKEMTAYAKPYDITIAVMGCRVNGPGETDDADLGLWCAPTFVNLKKGEMELGAYAYDQVLVKLREELDKIIATKQAAT